MSEETEDQEVTIKYTPLDEIIRWPRNPKDHDIGQLCASMRRHGFIDPIVRDATSGRIVAGHGRTEALTTMFAKGEDPPKRVKVLADGRWAVPVLKGIAFDNDLEAEAFLVASNRLVEIGGWDDKMLGEMLSDLRESEVSFEGIGFTQLELNSLLSTINDDRAVGKTPEEKLEQFLTSEVKQLNFYFDSAEYAEIVEKLDAVMADNDHETHTDAFVFLVQNYVKPE